MPKKSLRKVELKKKVDSKIRLYTNGDESCCNGDLGCGNKRFNYHYFKAEGGARMRNLKKVPLKKPQTAVELKLFGRDNLDGVLRASQGSENCCNGDKNCCSSNPC